MATTQQRGTILNERPQRNLLEKGTHQVSVLLDQFPALKPWLGG